jgi:hypothetical protein
LPEPCQQPKCDYLKAVSWQAGEGCSLFWLPGHQVNRMSPPWGHTCHLSVLHWPQHPEGIQVLAGENWRTHDLFCSLSPSLEFVDEGQIPTVWRLWRLS